MNAALDADPQACLIFVAFQLCVHCRYVHLHPNCTVHLISMSCTHAR